MTPPETPPPAPAKKPTISLTPGSRVRVHSAGAREEPFVSVGLFRGLVSVGGENSMAIEIEERARKAGRAEEGIRLIPLNAIMAIDILTSAKPEEEKRADPGSAQAYFR
jgi:hypothetical protein